MGFVKKSFVPSWRAHNIFTAWVDRPVMLICLLGDPSWFIVVRKAYVRAPADPG